MNSNRDKNKGFAATEAIIILVVVVIIGAVGYLAYSNFYASKPATTSSETTVTTDTSPDTFVVENEDDLDSAVKALDDVPLDDSETAELDSAINSF